MTTEINSAVWIEEAKKYGVDLSEALYQDKRAAYAYLDSLGLPRPATYIVALKDWVTHKRQCSDFINNYKPVFSRLAPHESKGKRPFHLQINTIKDLEVFINKNKMPVEEYDIHLVEKGVQQYSGIIIVNKKIVAEMVKGELINLTNRNMTPMTVWLDDVHTKYVFTNDKEFSSHEKALLKKAIKLVAHHQGYFEFYFIGSKLLFSNAQPYGGFVRI